MSEIICNLCNLQFLNIIIHSGNFTKLPQGMGNLINLRHFIFDSKDFMSNVKFPRGFGRLTSLRT